MYIRYYAEDPSLGDTSAEDCEKYRDWAHNILQAEFPEHEVIVLNEPSVRNAETDDFENEEYILDFCSRLWENCTLWG